MHRLFIDQNVRIEVAHALCDDGHEVLHASNANLDRREDADILRFANGRGLAIVTYDVDFAELAF